MVAERESAMPGGRARFLGCVVLESLADSSPLNRLTPVHVRREEHPGDRNALKVVVRNMGTVNNPFGMLLKGWLSANQADCGL